MSSDSDEASTYTFDGWNIEVRYRSVEGRPVIVGLDVRWLDGGPPPPSGLTKNLLREIVDLEVAQQDSPDPNAWNELLRRLATDEIGPTQGMARSEDFYCGIAGGYLLALNKAPRQPIKWMTTEYNKLGYDIDERTVSSWVNLARRHGLLTKGSKGRPGGLPTDKFLDRFSQIAQAKLTSALGKKITNELTEYSGAR